MTEKKDNRGGARPGAGRPKQEIERKYRSVYLSDDEYAEVKKFIKSIKN